MFPTTLTAIGCKIEGDRLGLGVDLFSGKETLFERLGLSTVNEEFKRKSSFSESVFG
jgi:phosphoglycerol transferase